MTGDGKPRAVRSYISQLAKGKRSLRFIIRLSSQEREGLEEDARQEGLSLSSYVRRLLTIRRGARLRGRAKAQGDDSGPPSSGKGK